jgi:hypothetical protein
MKAEGLEALTDLLPHMAVGSLWGVHPIDRVATTHNIELN